MRATLEILDGEGIGSRHQLWEGARIGRNSGDLLLNDPKVSGTHARVEKAEKGGLVLVDLNSSNGLKINGQKVRRVALLPGVIFWVGKTSFRVLELTDEPAPNSELLQAEVPWRQTLSGLIKNSSYKNPEPLNGVGGAPVHAFRPALELEFIEGPEFEKKVLLGYGPRLFGSQTLDIEILEPLCPPLAFEIKSQAGRAFFTTNFPKLVRLNESQTTNIELKEGDTIRIGQTLILVKFAA